MYQVRITDPNFRKLDKSILAKIFAAIRRIDETTAASQLADGYRKADSELRVQCATWDQFEEIADYCIDADYYAETLETL